MDVFDAISQRSSVRAYKTTDVEEDKLRKVLEAARLPLLPATVRTGNLSLSRVRRRRGNWLRLPSGSLLSGKHLLSLSPAGRIQRQLWAVVSPPTQLMFPLPVPL
jgi:nitroreductase